MFVNNNISYFFTLAATFSRSHFPSRWIFIFVFYRIDWKRWETSWRRRTEFNVLFTWFTTREGSFSCPFFAVHMIHVWENLQSRFLHTMFMCKKFSHRKCGLNNFQVCLHTLHPQSFSSSSSNSLTKVCCMCFAFSENSSTPSVKELENHSDYRRSKDSHIVQTNQIFAICLEISPKLNWKARFPRLSLDGFSNKCGALCVIRLIKSCIPCGIAA